MKLTPAERKALLHVAYPIGIYSKPMEKLLRRLAIRKSPLVLLTEPMQWQRVALNSPICMATITPAGKRALRAKASKETAVANVG
jgi:hypothetical protein